MEQTQKFYYKLTSFSKALKSFETALIIDELKFDPEMIDIIKNGRIQKFEFCSELSWKLIKYYLYFFHKIDTKSPRQTIKEFFLLEKLTQENYEKYLNMLDDRNQLSHIYNEDVFTIIHQRLNDYLSLMKLIIEEIQNDLQTERNLFKS